MVYLLLLGSSLLSVSLGETLALFSPAIRDTSEALVGEALVAKNVLGVKMLVVTMSGLLAAVGSEDARGCPALFWEIKDIVTFVEGLATAAHGSEFRSHCYHGGLLFVSLAGACLPLLSSLRNFSGRT
jgi:hypothetical protein